MKTTLSLIAGILFIIAFIPYIIAIVRRQTRPSKASWLIWAALDTIVLAGMYAEHTMNGQIIGATVGAWIIFVLSIKYGTSGWSRLDLFCLAGAVIGIGFWQTFNDPTLGILISCGVAILGSMPTFKSAWKNPAQEDKLAWTIFWLSCVCALAAIPAWTVADAAQPIAFSVIESTMMVILYIRVRFIQ
jgi:hypothetical protein